MKRINEPGEGKVQFRKEGRGSLRFGGKIIKPGQTFWAYPQDMPEVFRDTVVPVSPVTLEEDIKVTAPVFSLQSRGGGWFDIIDGLGKVVNEKALKRDAALKLIQELAG